MCGICEKRFSSSLAQTMSAELKHACKQASKGAKHCPPRRQGHRVTWKDRADNSIDVQPSAV